MKRIISAIFAGALILLGTETLAAEPARTRQRESKEALEAFEKTVPLTEADFEYELTEDGNGIRLTKYLGKEKRIRIPEEIEEIPVVEMADNLFPRDYGHEGWYSDSDSKVQPEVVYIPNSVEKICTFQENNNLKFIRLPEHLKEIPSETFYNCQALKEIYIPDSVKSIGNNAFHSSGLISIDFPDETKFKSSYYGNGGFCSWCTQLTNVTLPSSLSEIPEDMFSYCDSLTSIQIPDTVTTIKKSAFSFCYSLKTISLPANLESIEDYAFSGCKALFELSIPNTVRRIGENAFEYSSIKNLTIPNSVTTLGYNKKEKENGYISLGEANFDILIIPDWITKLYVIPKETKVINFPMSLEECRLGGYISNDTLDYLEDIIIPDTLEKVDFSDSDFSHVKLPLKTQKRLRELGYTGSFGGSRPARKQ